MGVAEKRTKDQEMSKRLPPSPNTWRSKPWEWPYHNNLGTNHSRVKNADKEKKRGA